MPDTFVFTLDLAGLNSLARSLHECLASPATIALWGDLGAGKTTFARLLIHTFMGEKIEVPSPTFTLVQVYEAPQTEIWHCDLYRLDNPHECFELGLEDAFHHALCLIEWPQRLGTLLPRNRLDIAFKIINDSLREITIAMPQPAEKYSRLADVLSKLCQPAL